MGVTKYKCDKHGEVEGLELEIDIEGWKAGQIICSKCMMENVLKGLVPLSEPVNRQTRRAFRENEITNNRHNIKDRRPVPLVSTKRTGESKSK